MICPLSGTFTDVIRLVPVSRAPARRIAAASILVDAGGSHYL
jgi:hypothetical protein